MKSSLDSLEQRAAQERNEIRQTTEELVSSIGNIRRQFTLSAQVNKHFAATSIFLCAFAFSLGYKTAAIFDLGRKRS